jgi:hypothetical protein
MSNLFYCLIITTIISQPAENIHLNALPQGNQVKVFVINELGGPVDGATVVMQDSRGGKPIRGDTSDGFVLLPEPQPPKDYITISATKNNLRSEEWTIHWTIRGDYTVTIRSQRKSSGQPPTKTTYVPSTAYCDSCNKPCYECRTISNCACDNLSHPVTQSPIYRYFSNQRCNLPTWQQPPLGY